MMNTVLNSIVGRVIHRLFLIVWPPLGENKMSSVDISIGIVLENNANVLYVISTDKNDNWTPIVLKNNLPIKIYNWNDLKTRIEMWMDSRLNDHIESEFYEVTNQPDFDKIVNHVIKDIVFINVNYSDPFGIRVDFENDFIQSTPISDGNTIETKLFNNNDNIKYFQRLGEIRFRSVLSSN